MSLSGWTWWEKKKNAFNVIQKLDFAFTTVFFTYDGNSDFNISGQVFPPISLQNKGSLYYILYFT